MKKLILITVTLLLTLILVSCGEYEAPKFEQVEYIVVDKRTEKSWNFFLDKYLNQYYLEIENEHRFLTEKVTKDTYGKYRIGSKYYRSERIN